jgi:hypothetical protein
VIFLFEDVFTRCVMKQIFSLLAFNYLSCIEDHMDTADSAYKLAVEKYETSNQQGTPIGWGFPCTFCLFALVFIALVS